MFSANENIQLRQHKRRIVQAVEATIPEEILDLGVNCMVMQVACQDPGCVPIETAIIIVFPASDVPLLPGLPASAGGSYKTKILKPMADVETPTDVLEALPPQFIGGLRTMQRLALGLRDAVLAQVQQLAPGDVAERQALAEYLQAALQEYIAHECVAPPLLEEYPNDDNNDKVETADSSSTKEEAAATTSSIAPVNNNNNNAIIPASGNYVMKRPSANDDDDKDTAAAATTSVSSIAATGTTTTTTTTTRPSQSSSSSSLSFAAPSPQRPFQQQRRPLQTYDSVSRRRQQAAATRNLLASMSSGSAGPPSQHARGLRRVGCPCCDPDNPANVVDQMMQL